MYAPPASPPSAAAPLVWLAQPTADEIDRAEAFVLDSLRAPASAKAGAHGSMVCFVGGDDRLEGCRPAAQPDDTPGFAEAALRLQPAYRLDPRSRPADGVVLVKVMFPRRFDEAPRVLGRPKSEEVVAAGPPGDLGAVQVLCRVTPEGGVEGCTAEKAEIDGADDAKLKAAALSLAGRFKVRPARAAGVPVAAYEVFNLAFTGNHRVVAAQWIAKPDARALLDAFPRRALEAGRSGTARMRCHVMTTGTLTGCEVVDETPDGFGFGAAALMLSSRFLMKPSTIDGKAVEGGEVVIPIRWETSGSTILSPGQAIKVFAWSPWLKAPDAAAVVAAYPKRAVDRNVSGRVSLRCELTKDGRPHDCVKTAVAPEGQGFSEAAMKLAKSFQSNMIGVTPAQLAEMRVTINFDFSPRSLAPPGDRFVRSLDWIHGPAPEAVQQAYPAEALKAGERNGLGFAQCLIGATGALEACRPAPGKPDELGFGAAAAKVASAMQANLWTQDGEAAVGQKVTAPIRMVYGADTPPAAAKPAS